ncbi:MAG: M23 family metallopeptidase [Clostridia bacterium]|nr:M23 family metallopeptidase [Clostridia bacterium]
MKEEKTKKRRLLYYLVLVISVCLLTAATVLTVYFVTGDKAGSLDNDPPGQVVTPPDGDKDPDKDKDPDDDKPTNGGAESFCDPVAYSAASVYNEIYTDSYNFSTRHEGVDFAAEEGAKVAAIADGTVTSISLNENTGNIITVDHGDGLVGIYRFVDPTSTLKVGAKVTKGECIATVSAACGPEKLDGTHLHLELEMKGKKVDPASYLDIKYQEK